MAKKQDLHADFFDQPDHRDHVLHAARYFRDTRYNIAHSILNSKNSYLVQEQRKQDIHPNDAFISGESGVQLKNIYPEVKAYCVFRNEHLLFSEKAEEPDYMDAYSVTPNFTDFFKLPLLSGDLRKTLSSPNEIARYPVFCPPTIRNC